MSSSGSFPGTSTSVDISSSLTPTLSTGSGDSISSQNPSTSRDVPSDTSVTNSAPFTSSTRGTIGESSPAPTPNSSSVRRDEPSSTAFSGTESTPSSSTIEISTASAPPTTSTRRRDESTSTSIRTESTSSSSGASTTSPTTDSDSSTSTPPTSSPTNTETTSTTTSSSTDLITTTPITTPPPTTTTTTSETGNTTPTPTPTSSIPTSTPASTTASSLTDTTSTSTSESITDTSTTTTQPTTSLIGSVTVTTVLTVNGTTSAFQTTVPTILPDTDRSSSGMSTGGVVGIVVGIVATVVLLLGVAFIMRERLAKRRRFAARRDQPSRPFLDAEMDDFAVDTPGPYEYGAVGSQAHLPQASGSMFRENFGADAGAPADIIFDSRQSGHKHQYSSSSANAPESQGLLKSVDGEGRFLDDVLGAYASNEKRRTVDEDGYWTDAQGQRHSRTRTISTTLSDYPPTPSSRAALLPRGSGAAASPPSGGSSPAVREPSTSPKPTDAKDGEAQLVSTETVPPLSPPPRNPLRLAPANPDPEENES